MPMIPVARAAKRIPKEVQGYWHARRRYLCIGEACLKPTKVGSRWMVDAALVKQTIESEVKAAREREKKVKEATRDYRKRVLWKGHVETEWGGYEVYGKFHECWSLPWTHDGRDDRRPWYCNGCFELAELAHNAPECHRCSEWGSCGTDCTLSRIFCPRCKTSRKIR